MPRLRTLVFVAALAGAFFWFGMAVIGPVASSYADGSGRKAPKGVEKMLPVAKKALKKGRVGTTRVGGEQAVLAAWKEGTKDVRLVNVRNGRSKTEGFDVKIVGKPNGVNTRYEIERPEDWHVLAIRTNVRKDLRGRRSMPATYVPYGDHIDAPQFREAGRRYLEGLVERAGDKLDDLDVASRADGERLVTEAVPWKVLMTLLVIEHIDPDDFTARGVDDTMNRVLATIGANKDDSYDYAISEKAAGGLAQFIPTTYAEIRAKYPEANITKDFLKGMRDHRNAVKIQYCFIDYALAQLDAADLKKLAEDDEELGAYLAAAYNHGQNGAAKVYAAHGEDWDEPGNGIGEGSLLYVKEFRAVYRKLWGK
ncbi:MAG: hypothetical protein AAB554_05640 [Patescibacteria group bacterium]